MSKKVVRIAAFTLLMIPMSLHVRGDDTQDSGGVGSEKSPTVIATVFGESLYLKGVTPSGLEAKRQKLSANEFAQWLRTNRGRRIYDNVWRVVQQEYIEREELGVTKQELAEIAASVELQWKAMESKAVDSTLTPAQRKLLLRGVQCAILQDWKVCKSLYEEYGGRVGLGSLGAWVAFDGQNALLRKHHKSGDIKFHDPAIEKAFWKHTQIKNFADAYPTGEGLKRLLSTPPHLRNRPAEVERVESLKSFGGKTLDQWIAVAKTAAELKARQDAMHVVRDFGLQSDRTKTLAAFADLLSDDAPTIRSLAVVGLKKADRPTSAKAMEKLIEILSQDLSNVRAPQQAGEVGAEFGLMMRAVGTVGSLGETPHIPVLKRIAENKKIDSRLRRAARDAIGQIESRPVTAPSNREKAEAIRKLKFLVGTWKSVEPDNAPPAAETRKVAVQPDRLALVVTTESVLGKGRPVQITFNSKMNEYLLTYTTSAGENREFHAKLTAVNKLEIPIPESAALFSGLNMVVVVSDGQWTETIEQSSKPSEVLYKRSFARQRP